jgi:hypothetical protein
MPCFFNENNNKIIIKYIFISTVGTRTNIYIYSRSFYSFYKRFIIV